jgi:hypothetical protein
MALTSLPEVPMSRLNLGKKITLRLDDRLCAKLQDFADQERVPVSSVMRHLVIRFFDGKPVVTSSFLGPVPSSRSTVSTLATRAEMLQAEFRDEVLTLFDVFRGQGCDPKEAAKRVNFTLKGKKHPWATYETISGVLRKAGRFRKQKGVRA